MWRVLSTIPADHVEEIVISFAPHEASSRERELELHNFAWVEFVSRLRSILTHLNKITIRLGGVYFLHPSPEFRTCVDAMRTGGLKQFEEEGLVSFDVTTVSSSNELVVSYGERTVSILTASYHSLNRPGDKLQIAGNAVSSVVELDDTAASEQQPYCIIRLYLYPYVYMYRALGPGPAMQLAIYLQ